MAEHQVKIYHTDGMIILNVEAETPEEARNKARTMFEEGKDKYDFENTDTEYLTVTENKKDKL